MIKKIFMERTLLYGVTMNVIASVKMAGCQDIENIKTAIDFAVNRFESLRCRILQDTNGEAYYVMREERVVPYIEVRNYHMDIQEFTNQQERMPFRWDKGEMARFYIEDLGSEVYLRIVVHHVAGDGKSVMMLADEIMKNLSRIEENTFTYEDEPIVPLKQYGKEFFEEHFDILDLMKCSMDEFNEKWKKEERKFSYADYLDIFNKYWSVNRMQVKCLKVSPSEMKNLHSLGKANNVSINSIIMTAAAKALVEPEKILVVVDARPEGWKGMGNYAGGIQIEGMYDASKSFWENAKYNHNQTHAQIVDRRDALIGTAIPGLLNCNLRDAVALNETGCYDNKIAHMYDDAFGMKKNSFAFIISNIGADLVKPKYGEINVEEVEFESPVIPKANCNMAVTTVGGVMNIVMQYRENCEINYEMMLNQMEDILMKVAHEADIEREHQLA